MLERAVRGEALPPEEFITWARATAAVPARLAARRAQSSSCMAKARGAAVSSANWSASASWKAWWALAQSVHADSWEESCRQMACTSGCSW